MKIPCELYFMDKDRVRGELIGSFEDIEAARAYIEEVCTKIPLVDDSSFRIVRLANVDKVQISPCPACGNDSLFASELPDLDGYAKIMCRQCGLTVKAKAVGEQYTKFCGDLYWKRPAKSAVQVTMELWNAMARNY